MRLLFVCPYYPPYAVGGAEESTFLLAEALQGRGHDVEVVSPLLGAADPATSVPVRRVSGGVKAGEPGVALRPGDFDRPYLQLRVALAIARAARRVDVVHCQTLHLLPAAYVGSRLARTPVVATIRDLGGVCPLSVCLLERARVPHDCGVVRLEKTCLPAFRSLYGGRSAARHAVAALVRFGTARARSALLRRCDAVYGISRDIGELYSAAGLVAAESVTVLPNPARTHTTSAPGPRDVAVYAGKVSHGKGVDYLLEATRRLREMFPDFRLVVAGHADARWRERLAAEPAVDFVGRLSREELSALYERARVAVVPSIWPEPLGRAALEASGAGVAVVASRAGGLPEVVLDGETGFLVEPRDAAALAAAIERLWRDPALATRLGETGRRRVRDTFSLDTIAARAEGLYELVVGADVAGRATTRNAVAHSGRR